MAFAPAAAALPAIGMGAADMAAAGALGGGLLAPTTAAAAPGILGGLSGMSAEQAAMIAAQNSGMGIGADLATLQAANYAAGAPMTKLSGLLGKIDPAMKMMGAMQGGQQQPMMAMGGSTPSVPRMEPRRFPRPY